MNRTIATLLGLWVVLIAVLVGTIAFLIYLGQYWNAFYLAVPTVLMALPCRVDPAIRLKRWSEGK